MGIFRCAQTFLQTSSHFIHSGLTLWATFELLSYPTGMGAGWSIFARFSNHILAITFVLLVGGGYGFCWL
jgi:hypothetical protein